MEGNCPPHFIIHKDTQLKTEELFRLELKSETHHENLKI